MAKDSKNEVSIIISGTQLAMSTTAPPTGCKGATRSKEVVLKGGVRERKQLVSDKRLTQMFMSKQNMNKD